MGRSRVGQGAVASMALAAACLVGGCPGALASPRFVTGPAQTVAAAQSHAAKALTCKRVPTSLVAADLGATMTFTGTQWPHGVLSLFGKSVLVNGKALVVTQLACGYAHNPKDLSQIGVSISYLAEPSAARAASIAAAMCRTMRPFATSYTSPVVGAGGCVQGHTGYMQSANGEFSTRNVVVSLFGAQSPAQTDRPVARHRASPRQGHDLVDLVDLVDAGGQPERAGDLGHQLAVQRQRHRRGGGAQLRAIEVLGPGPVSARVARRHGAPGPGALQPGPRVGHDPPRAAHPRRLDVLRHRDGQPDAADPHRDGHRRQDSQPDGLRHLRRVHDDGRDDSHHRRDDHLALDRTSRDRVAAAPSAAPVGPGARARRVADPAQENRRTLGVGEEKGRRLDGCIEELSLVQPRG